MGCNSSKVPEKEPELWTGGADVAYYAVRHVARPLAHPLAPVPRFSAGPLPGIRADEFWDQPFTPLVDFYADPERRGSDVFYDSQEPRIDVVPSHATKLSTSIDISRFKTRADYDAHVLRSRRLTEGKLLPRAGATMRFLYPEAFEARVNETAAGKLNACCATTGDPTTIKVRGVGYRKHGKKEIANAATPYELFGSDLFGTEERLDFVTSRVRLPGRQGLSPEVGGLPRYLVVNIALPDYATQLVGSAKNGPGRSVVLYFRLKEDFDPKTFALPRALDLFRTFLADAPTAQGSHLESRLKLIARVNNVAAWSKAAAMSRTETKLVTNYNAKPVLTKPQHYFKRGEDYFEICLDVHIWNYLARRALTGFRGRLGALDYTIALIIQTEHDREAPEMIFCCGRLLGTDMTYVPPPAPADPADHGLMTPEAIRKRMDEMNEAASSGESEEEEWDFRSDGNQKGKSWRRRRKDARRRGRENHGDGDDDPKSPSSSSVRVMKAIAGTMMFPVKLVGKVVRAPIQASARCTNMNRNGRAAKRRGRKGSATNATRMVHTPRDTWDAEDDVRTEVDPTEWEG